VDKYEYRTQARTLAAVSSGVRSDSMLERWANGVQKGASKTYIARA
jgi:hypothetical protein